jgi:hypothetical protein
MGIEFKKNIGELELGLQFLLNFSHEWELEWESPWFLDQLLISGFLNVDKQLLFVFYISANVSYITFSLGD